MIDNIQGLYLKLLGRIKRALSWQHLIMENGIVTVDDDLAVRGRFEWDEEIDGELPLLIIDGKPVTWDDFGRILRTYEGWRSKLQIFDPSDEPT